MLIVKSLNQNNEKIICTELTSLKENKKLKCKSK